MQLTVNCYYTSFQIVLHLVELTPNINVQDEDGWSPLIYSAKTESPATMKYLLQKGANTNLRVVIILHVPLSQVLK